MNYIIRIIDFDNEVLTTIRLDENPSQDHLDELVALHGGSYADVSRAN